MNILYFYQYFSTPKGAWGTRVYEFAKEWVKNGHEVTVVSSIYSKSDLEAKKLIEDQYFEGIHVKVINVKIDNKQGFLKRIWTFIQYSVLSSYYAIRLPADVVIASSGPITAGIPGLVAKYIRGRKMVFEVRDLWPEGAIELGIIKHRGLQRLAYWFERLCYRASSYIITLSPGMTRNIKDRYGCDKVTDVTNAANISMFSSLCPFVSDKVKPKSYAIYTGNIGMVNNSVWLFEAAKELQLRGRSDVKILLVGEGQQREALTARAANEGLENFIHLGLMPKQELVAYIQNAFASLVPLKGTPVLDTSSPNKFFESLAAGVPVIQNTQGWMKTFLAEKKVGFTLDPNDAGQLAEKLIWMKDNPEAIKEMGQTGQRVAREEFDKDVLAQKMLQILLQVHEQKT